MEIFINELAKKLGPKSGTGKILAVDGEPYLLPAYQGELLSYFIAQSYYATSPTNYDTRINQLRGMKGFSTRKFIVTEDFERYTTTGGGAQLVSSFRVKVDPKYYISGSNPPAIPSLLGMAYWNPADGRKGGVDSYHMEYEYPNAKQDYYYIRQAIQIMNPAPY